MRGRAANRDRPFLRVVRLWKATTGPRSWRGRSEAESLPN